MFALIKRKKRAVSPVVAVVLLIALTVAAAAVIWAIVNGYLGTGQATLVVKSNESATAVNGTGYTWKVIFTVGGESVTISSMNIDNATSTISTSSTLPSLNVGDSSVLTFTFASGGTTAGTHTITVQWATSGGNPQTSTFKVSFT